MRKVTNKVGLLFHSRYLYANIHDPLQSCCNKATLQHFQNLNLFSSLLVWFFYLKSPPAFSLHPAFFLTPFSLSGFLQIYIFFHSGVQGSGTWGVLSSSVPRRTTLSWGKDDRKSARWHRAGLQHVTSSPERQDARRGGGWSEEKEEGVGE